MRPDSLLFFEKDFWPALECMPMGVRFKLDCCGIKLSLRYWQQLSVAEREQLVTMGCEASDLERLRTCLTQLAHRYGFALVPIAADPAPYREQPIPGVESADWQKMTLFERFVCAKLSTSSRGPALLPEVIRAVHSRTASA